MVPLRKLIQKPGRRPSFHRVHVLWGSDVGSLRSFARTCCQMPVLAIDGTDQTPEEVLAAYQSVTPRRGIAPTYVFNAEKMKRRKEALRDVIVPAVLEKFIIFLSPTNLGDPSDPAYSTSHIEDNKVVDHFAYWAENPEDIPDDVFEKAAAEHALAESPAVAPAAVEEPVEEAPVEAPALTTEELFISRRRKIAAAAALKAQIEELELLHAQQVAAVEQDTALLQRALEAEDAAIESCKRRRMQ